MDNLKNNICRICGCSDGLKSYDVKERQLNKGDSFEYILCPKCGCLQLEDDVDDMSAFYGESYYSFNASSIDKPLSFFDKTASWLLPKLNHLPALVRMAFKRTGLIVLQSTHIKKTGSIVDVGGGAGQFAHKLARLGFRDVTTIDLYCKSSPYTDIQFLSCSLMDIKNDKKYDLITFQDSFEHMNNPLEILVKAGELINDKGVIAIQIPIVGMAWNLYSTDDYCIDAPRHYYIHTYDSMNYLCDKAGLKIISVENDSSSGAYYKSESYRDTDLPLREIAEKMSSIPGRERSRFRKMAIRSNKTNKADHAVFYIKKKSLE